MEYAFAFATVVQLLGLYKSEQSADDGADLRSYLAWLGNHHHNELKDFIDSNSDFSTEVAALLQGDHDKIRAEIRAVQETCLSIARNLETLSGLASLSDSESDAISKHALQLLTLFVECGGTQFHPLGGNPPNRKITIAIANALGSIEVDKEDSKYFEDDMNSLVAAGFVDEDYGNDGNKIYRLRRNAARFVQQLDRESVFSED